MSDELKPCPFCGSEAGLSKGGRALCSNEGCIACDLFAPVEDWNRRAQPAEAEGVDFGFDDRSVKVSQEAYSIFLARERHHLAALSAVTAERDRLREEMAELWKRIDKFQSQSHGITALAEIERLRAEVEALRPIHAMILNALDRDAEEGKAARGEMAAELRAAMAAKEA